MALIKCPECGKEVSDRAKICIHCGYPLKEDFEEEKEKNEGKNAGARETDYKNGFVFVDGAGYTNTEKPDDAEKKKRIRNTIIAVVIVVAAIIICIAIGIYRGNSSDRLRKQAQEARSSYQEQKAKVDELEREKAEVEAEIDAIESNR